MKEPNYGAPFYLSDWYVDTTANRLHHDETEVRLEGKVMAVLHYLAQHPNELVTREALERAIWGKTVVGYDALTRCIAQLRKALGDDSREPRYIETISKKGYRLIAPVTRQATIEQQAKNHTTPTSNKTDRYHTNHRFIWITGLGILLLGFLMISNYQPSDRIQESNRVARSLSQPSIVVLPFANLGTDPEQRYFTDGVTADITTALSKLSGLLVISQSSAMSYLNRSSDIKQAAESLGVRYVLEGSVRRTEDRIRMNVNLIDSNSDIVLWSEKYDRELRSVFDVQDNITGNIIDVLSVKLTEEEKRRTAGRYTTSIDAYDDFLKGQFHYIRHSREDNHLARSYFQQAIDRDASFARAYSAMALTYVAEHRYAWIDQPDQQMDRALQLATRGISLDPELPQAYWVLGYVHLFRREYQQAAQAAHRAIDIDPNYADSYLTLAICMLHKDKPKQALSLVRKALLINPEYPAAYASILGQSYFFTGQYEMAATVLSEAIDRNNNLLTAHVFLIASLSKQGRMDEAGWAVEQLKLLATDFSDSRIAGLLPVDDASTIDDMKRHLQRAGL